MSSSNDKDNEEATAAPSTTNETTPTTLQIPYDFHYSAPLADLISRLKMVSITGCFLSVIVMPALVFLKNGDLPNAQQASMGGVATFGAVTSTAALHFVFGAYVLDMQVVADSDDEDGQQQWVLLEATTRSILGFTKVTHLFNPYTDVGIYKGNRPFANFTARGVPLYVHPERLDEATRKLLLQGGGGGILSKQNEQHDSEGLSKPNSKTKKDDDDDELFWKGGGIGVCGKLFKLSSIE